MTSSQEPSISASALILFKTSSSISVTGIAPAGETKEASTPYRCASHLFSMAMARSTASSSELTKGRRQRWRTKQRYKAAIASASSMRVQQSVALSSRVGYFSDGLIAHQTCVAFGTAPEETSAET